MDQDYLIAMQNMKDSTEKVGIIHNSVSQMQTEMRGKSMDFYYKLSLLSGGILSLSITYIGYLASVPSRHIIFGELLFLGWTCLLIALFSSMYRNIFNLDMGHYQTTNVLNNARLKELESSLVVLEKYPQQFINLKTKEEVNKQIETTKRNISIIEKAIKNVKNKENRESSLWFVSQKAANISFFLGVIFITVFASLNLPLNVDFTLLHLK